MKALTISPLLSLVMVFALLTGGCATSRPAVERCGDGPTDKPCPPAGTIDDPQISELYEHRRYLASREIDFDPIEVGVEADIPIVNADGLILGATSESAMDSLAAKIWMIENAEHTVDLVYYIFRLDLAGYAMIGAMCNAVHRGVDVRFMVDAVGSLSTSKTTLRALELCEERAGFMRNADGELTDRRARIQVAIFNAVTNLQGSPNRRSHDKFLVKDGLFADKAFMMTGGRNISNEYYGFTEDGEIDPHTYRDSDILFRSDGITEGRSLGEISSDYVTLLFLYRGNRLLRPVSTENARNLYARELTRAQKALRDLKALPIMKDHFDGIEARINGELTPARVQLAHNLANMDSRRVVRKAVQNLENNPNSILYVLKEIRKNSGGDQVARIVTPYPFLARHKDKDGNILVDEAQAIRQWIEENPEAELEIIVNSVLTSDNFSTQAIIDMDTAPRLLLDPEMREAWLNLSFDDELQGELTRSQEWINQVSHPRLRIYETGRMDSDKLQADGVAYGKLHAKFWLEDDIGFVGTDNFDYRSRLYNNEMGYFFESQALADQLEETVQLLKSMSYRWGSPEWLEMRRKVAEGGGMTGRSTRSQRTIFKTLRATGLIWIF